MKAKFKFVIVSDGIKDILDLETIKLYFHCSLERHNLALNNENVRRMSRMEYYMDVVYQFDDNDDKIKAIQMFLDEYLEIFEWIGNSLLLETLEEKDNVFIATISVW